MLDINKVAASILFKRFIKCRIDYRYYLLNIYVFPRVIINEDEFFELIDSFYLSNFFSYFELLPRKKIKILSSSFEVKITNDDSPTSFLGTGEQFVFDISR